MEVQLIIDEYRAGKLQSEIAEQLHCAQTTISGILRRNNVVTRVGKHITYTDINIDFFKEINCEANAYFLGLLYADGDIQQYTMQLKLENTDRDIVEQFRDIMSPSSPIKITEVKYCYFRTNQKVIVDQLTALGCVAKKSLILEFPTCVPEELIRHFLRGYTDGDGCIRKQEHKSYTGYTWKITSTGKFCDVAENILKRELNVNCCREIDDNGITTSIIVGGNNQVEKVLDWLYGDATIYMNRKYDLYKSFKAYKSVRPYVEFKRISLSDMQKQAMIQLYSNGMASTKLAIMFGISKPSVLKILHKSGIKMRANVIGGK